VPLTRKSGAIRGSGRIRRTATLAAVTKLRPAVLYERMEASSMTLPARGHEGQPASLPSAFERLFRTEYARVVGIAQRILDDTAEAEDVAQDVFMSFYRAHPANASYAAPWLHAAAAHAALNALRTRSRRTRREAADAIAPEAADPVDPAESATASETRDEVRAILARLPERSAALLALRYSGLSYAEIAAALDVRASSVGTLLRRAEDAFRRELG
jgi:RNA polymerase sigma factor (sigma-70 family)